jgi:chromosome segregation ATPase
LKRELEAHRNRGEIFKVEVKNLQDEVARLGGPGAKEFEKLEQCFNAKSEELETLKAEFLEKREFDSNQAQANDDRWLRLLESEKCTRHEIVFKIFELDAKLDPHNSPQSTADETWRRIYSSSQESQLSSVSQSLHSFHQNYLSITHKTQTLQSDFQSTLHSQTSHLHSQISSLQAQISSLQNSHNQTQISNNSLESQISSLQTQLSLSKNKKKTLKNQLLQYTENLDKNASEFESK